MRRAYSAPSSSGRKKRSRFEPRRGENPRLRQAELEQPPLKRSRSENYPDRSSYERKPTFKPWREPTEVEELLLETTQNKVQAAKVEDYAKLKSFIDDMKLIVAECLHDGAVRRCSD